MEYNDIKERLIFILEKKFNLSDSNSQDLWNIEDYLDSLSLIQLIVEIEIEFDIELYDEELDINTFSSIDKTAQIILNHMNETIL